ncbi:MAG: protein-L-isoaspartate O-methyltransferase family protein [Alphaproteobacteria bacterium]
MTIKQRQTMIDGQLLPAGIIDENLLRGFLHINREEFVDDDSGKNQKCAYSDKSLLLKHGRLMLPAIASGVLLQYAMLKKNDKVLLLGGGQGYECNILAWMGIAVVAIQSGRDKIKKNILKGNFMVISGDMDITKGYKSLSPYKAIILLGLLKNIPEKLLSQLDDDGVMMTILRDKNSPLYKNQIGNLVRITKQKKIDYLGQVAGLSLMPEFIDEKTINRLAS